MIYTDENGEEYEEARGEAIPFDNKGMVMPYGFTIIRPIKEEPKWEVKSVQQDYQGCWVSVKFGDVTNAQASLIKEAIEALMIYVNGGSKDTSELGAAAYRTMRALQKDKI